MSQEELEKEKKSISISPHLALTHMETQGGAANGRNVSLLMKADIESLTDEQIALLKSIVGEEVVVEKLSHYGLRNKLDKLVRDRYALKEWDWAYVVDFDNTHVVFSMNDGLYAVTYSIEAGEVRLGTDAFPVNRIISYEEESGELVLTESVDGVDMNILALVEKSFDKISNDERLKSVYKSKYEEGKVKMEQKIAKAVADALAPVQSELEKANADLQSAKAELEEAKEVNVSLQKALDELKQTMEEAKDQARLEKLKEVVADEEQAQELAKSLAALEDEDFDKVVEVYKAKESALKGSHLFKQMSDTNKPEGEQENYVTAQLKAKYKQDK